MPPVILFALMTQTHVAPRYNSLFEKMKDRDISLSSNDIDQNSNCIVTQHSTNF